MICLVVEIFCPFAWRDSLVSEAGDSFSTRYSPALLCTYGPKILTCCYRAHECTALVLKWQRPCRLACGISKGRTVADVGLWPLIKIFAVTTTDFCTAEQQAGLPLLGADTNCGAWATFTCLDAVADS